MTRSEAKKYAPRSVRPSVWLGLGLLLLAAVGFWLRGEKTPSDTVSDTARPGTVSHIGTGLLQDDLSAPASLANELSKSIDLRRLARRLESIQRDTDAAERANRIERVVEGVAASDLAAAIAFLNGITSSEINSDVKLRLIRRWAERDPRSASDWVSRTLIVSERQESINAVAIVWANQNLSDAADWTRQLPTHEERNGALMNVAYEAARNKPIEALRLASELPAGEYRDDLVSHTASEWAAKDPTAAAEWASQIIDVALRDRVLVGVVTSWGETDPVAAANLALKSLPPGKPRDDAVVGIVQQWVQKQPFDAAAWVLAFPDGQLRNTALEELVRLWGDKNIEEPAEWLNAAALGLGRDAAVSAYVNKMMLHFPELAALWAGDIGDEELRLREMEAVAESWMLRGDSAARAWVAQSDFSETTRLRLLALSRDH
jgi:hypothetical protein